MHAVEMIKERRSVRTFKNERVSRETMRNIVGYCPESWPIISAAY